MKQSILEKIKYLGEAEETSSLVRYYDKEAYNNFKRLLRMSKRMAKKDRIRKLGFYLEKSRELGGRDKDKEEIIRKIFGTSQQMLPDDFRKKLLQLASETFPKGDYVLLNPETNYQTTQRLIANASKNRTLGASIYGDILSGLIKDFVEKNPEFDEMYRQVHSFSSSGHFRSGTAAFVRYTKLTDDWLHFDAFQTDYFNKLRNYLYKNSEEEKTLINKFIKTIESREFDFYKTAVSYIVRNNPKVKIFTSNTEEIVKRVENVRGSGKLRILYNDLPKALGFKLIPVEKLLGIFATRPGKRELEKSKFITKALSVKNIPHVRDAVVKKTLLLLDKEFSENAKIKDRIKDRAQLDDFVKKVIDSKITEISQEARERLKVAFHQVLVPMYEALKSKEEKAMETFLAKKDVFNEIKSNLVVPESKGPEKTIWWANRTTIFEETESEKDTIIRIINS